MCAALVRGITFYFGRLAESGISGIMEEYCANSAVLGKDVKVQCQNGSVSGRCAGFGDAGQLLVDTGGRVEEFHAGDVSLRGADGYV